MTENRCNELKKLRQNNNAAPIIEIHCQYDKSVMWIKWIMDDGREKEMAIYDENQPLKEIVLVRGEYLVEVRNSFFVCLTF